MTPARFRSLVSVLLLSVAAGGCTAAQSEDARFRRAVAQTPPMINPALTRSVDPAVSSSWDSTYRMLSFSPREVCFLAEWNVPPHVAPSLQWQLEGWRSLDEDRRTVPRVVAHSIELVDRQVVARIKKDDPPAADDVPPEIRAMAPPLTPMRVCFRPTVIQPETRYLLIWVEPDARHRTGAGWRLVPPASARR
ncbi:MAG TPA: hypothetical protein VFU21_25520 [Kofleriaceae bacterium]|nr:hypothetical protein [Kofleriaceae bacterium]